jgi:hypothetical protein
MLRHFRLDFEEKVHASTYRLMAKLADAGVVVVKLTRATASQLRSVATMPVRGGGTFLTPCEVEFSKKRFRAYQEEEKQMVAEQAMDEYWERFGNVKGKDKKESKSYLESTEENEKYEEDDISTSASDYSEEIAEEEERLEEAEGV